MTKTDLQQQLDARGIEYDKRWSVGKLKAALNAAVKPEVKSEDKLGIDSEDGETETVEDTGDEAGKEKNDEKPQQNETIEREKNASEDSAGQSENTDENDVDETTHALRENAKIAAEHHRKIVNSATNNRIKKLGRKTYLQKKLTDAVQIYEKESGRLIRTYSLADHGKGYAALADKFINTRKGVMDAPVKITQHSRPIVT